MITAYNENEKAQLKTRITSAFYGAYFGLKGQKGLRGSDLEEVLNGIDKPGGEMSDEDMLNVLKRSFGR